MKSAIVVKSGTVSADNAMHATFSRHSASILRRQCWEPPGAASDGEYVINESTGKADVRLKVTFPANGMSVFGIKNPYEWSIDVTTTLDPQHTRGQLMVQTSLQRPLTAQYDFMRPLPEAA